LLQRAADGLLATQARAAPQSIEVPPPQAPHVPPDQIVLAAGRGQGGEPRGDYDNLSRDDLIAELRKRDTTIARLRHLCKHDPQDGVSRVGPSGKGSCTSPLLLLMFGLGVARKMHELIYARACRTTYPSWKSGVHEGRPTRRAPNIFGVFKLVLRELWSERRHPSLLRMFV
jgi:hypothetical protein